MRIGVDARALTGRWTGDRTYWLNLVRGLLESVPDKDDLVLYTRLPLDEGLLPAGRRCVVRMVPAANDRLWTMLHFPRALRSDGIDIAHTQYTTPLRAPCPLITTVHDISFRLYPEWFPRKHRMLLNLSVPVAMRRARIVITDSASSRRDILRIYRLAPDKVEAIHLAAAPEYVPVPADIARRYVQERFGISDPFVLSVGVLQPRKNFALLVEACARALRKKPLPHKLVLTGKRGWRVDEITRLAARLDLLDRMIFTDYVPDDALPLLYSATDVMAYPSLYEGFGLPPLEAMACGAPTLVSDAPAMPEVVGDGAWVLPVMDACAWADGLIAMLTDERVRRCWSERARARAACFSWKETTRKTLRAYYRALGLEDKRNE
ncbi:MAG: glycosyltransferase family 4 protein [Chthonomonadales bacterium]